MPGVPTTIAHWRTVKDRVPYNLRSSGKRELAAALRATRARTFRVLENLLPQQWRVPMLAEINPPLWELGHIGWFAEHWCLRWREGRVVAPPMLPRADDWYDSRTVAHGTRWQLDLPDFPRTQDYLTRSLHQVLERLEASADKAEQLYPFRLALFHEDMHIEALCYMHQTLAYDAPAGLAAPDRRPATGQELIADIPWKGGVLPQGMPEGTEGFVFDNEKWQHEVTLRPYAISSDLVNNAEFLGFVADGGYTREEFWDAGAFAALGQEGRVAPRYWRYHEGEWLQRIFSNWQPLAPDDPVRHVDAFEAEAYCRWAGRRLPSEAEWEHAASRLQGFHWGRLWEWTATPFEPYPGFSADRYQEYSVPWFGTHRVVRGASFVTPRSYIHPAFRNFYEPHRGDIFVGFRTCAL
jgi:iron(II)-dependent oxidoreductase